MHVIGDLFNIKVVSPQSASSDRSRQSKSPSHFQVPWMHSPLAQWNSREWHCGAWGVVLLSCVELWVCFLQFSGHSSELSRQSGSPSQAHRRGMQTVLLHWKDEELQVTAGQESSSLPSLQSASLSHTKVEEMHWPFLQRNSEFVHCLGATTEG